MQKNENNIIIYQDENGITKVTVRFVDEDIIKLMPIELVNKIPSKFREMIVEEKDKTYIPDIKEPL